MISYKRTFAVARKEFIQIMRDPRSLALALFIPILLLVLFGYGLSLDIENVPVAVWDQDGSITATDFVLNFKFTKYFKIIGSYDNYRILEKLIDERKAMMAMVVLKDFTRYIQQNGKAPVQLILDGSDANTATIALGYAQTIVGKLNNDYIKQALEDISIESPTPVDLRTRIWFNQDLESKNFIVPGIVAIIMMVIAALLTSLTIAKEWERGTMEQLISTPVRPLELILGKFSPYFIIGFIDLVVSVLMGHFVFRVPFRGNLLLLFALSSFFLSGALMLGIFISIVARTQLLASQMAMLSTFLPTFLLSGFTYEIFNMPQAVQYITYLVPARYFIVILRSIYLKGVGLKYLWVQALLLLIFAVIATFLAVRRFKKKIPVI